MKYLPSAAVTLTCAALLLAGCHKVPVAATADQQEQERLAEEHQAQQERELHEKEAALDERERVLTEREQQLANAAAAPSASAAPSTPAPAAAPPAQPAAPSLNASYQLFYDALAPYGVWVEMPGYGYVWQPSATAQDGRWRPYTMGHWVYTDNGWTWLSDEPFGWITYHYGRWMRTSSLNWVWVPGDQWAPAWVSWRYGNDFVGWAPLPPEARFDGATGIQQWADLQYNLGASDYTFVPAADFGDENMANVEVPFDQDEPIYDESNNVTNIYYDTGAYAIICYGPSYDFMRSKCRRPLPPQMKLRGAGYIAGGNNGAFVSGNTLQVTAPRIVRSQNPTAPKTLRGRVADIRQVSPAGTPPPHGSAQPPLYQPPAGVASGTPGAGMQMPSQMNPVPVRHGEAGGANQPPPSPEGMRIPSGMRPTPLPADVEAQKGRDLQIIQQQQAAEQQAEQQRAAEAVQAAAEKQQAELQRASDAAARAAAAKAEAGNAAREQVARQEAARQAQAESVPASTGAPGQGRNQQ